MAILSEMEQIGKKDLIFLSNNSKTPLMKQYNKIKEKYPDALLLFRVGDFYETFHEDAVKTSKILGIVLTKRGAGSNSETKLAGFPHHSLNTYLHKLVKAGERVAICDQLEDPKTTKTIVKRGVTELVTPGVSLNDGILEKKSNNFLASIYNLKDYFGISFLDISTGEFLISQGNIDYIKNLLQSFDPKEILISKKHKKEFNSLFGDYKSIFYLEQWIYNKDFAIEKIKNQFQILNLKGFGLKEDNLGVIACGSILHYLEETQHSNLSHITNINQIIDKEFVWMDRFTMINLELLRSNSKDGISLIDVIDYTSTPMGGRMLKRWIIHPIIDLKELEFRHKAVDYFVKNNHRLDQICTILKSFSDLERIMAKVATSKISPRELVQLKNNLISIKPLKELLDSSSNKFVQKISNSLDLCEKLIDILDTTLDQEAPISVSKGNVVKKGFNSELDQLKDLSKSGKNYLNEIQNREIDNTGISSLKISFNNVFGYYLEVRNVHKDKVPEDWIRKQTLVNAERYITQELKDYESKILGAEEKILSLETQIFNDLILKLRPFISVIKTNSNWLAVLDCLCGFGILAEKMNYSYPTISNSNEIKIIQGRHPVIESKLPHENPYIPNDISISNESNQILMITGPNMSGKSAILRQTALIVLLAQIGSFVPAKRVEMGIVDKIFTRVGASDNISVGESTFMVEMTETANILHNASERSLVLMDEVGRGTSTFDGLSLAWACAFYLADKIKSFTLFATHYFELTSLPEQIPSAVNIHLDATEYKDSIVFLHSVQEGPASQSYGIQVAKLAGIPSDVISLARAELKKLESSSLNTITSKTVQKEISSPSQEEMFINQLSPELKKKLGSISPDELSPKQALDLIYELKLLM